jgi:uncharacterized protein involved in outer membrane biogenesis
VQPDGKVLPVEKFNTERWKALDADVRFTADRIVKDADLPISKLTRPTCDEQRRADAGTAELRLAGGTVNSNIRSTAAARGTRRSRPRRRHRRHIKIKQLFPQIEKMQATVGEIYGQAKLTATGDSVGEMLATRTAK